MEGLEQNISQFLCKPAKKSKQHCTWAHQQDAVSLTGPTEELKSTRAWEVLLNSDSSDITLSSAGIMVRTGRK